MFCSEQGDLSSCRFIFVRSNDLRCSFPVGIKDYSNWPTIPQVYLNGEFVGGCDILLQMHQNGDLVEELKKLGIRSALLDETKDQDSSEGGGPGRGAVGVKSLTTREALPIRVPTLEMTACTASSNL